MTISNWGECENLSLSAVDCRTPKKRRGFWSDSRWRPASERRSVAVEEEERISLRASNQDGVQSTSGGGRESALAPPKTLFMDFWRSAWTILWSSISEEIPDDALSFDIKIMVSPNNFKSCYICPFCILGEYYCFPVNFDFPERAREPIIDCFAHDFPFLRQYLGKPSTASV